MIIPYGQPLPQPSPVAARRPRTFVVPPLPEYAAILQSPIFTPDRKPGEDAGAAPGASVLDSYTALGVATGRGFATAVIKGPGDAAKTVRRGDTVEGWTLVGLDSAKLTFERGGARRTLTIGAASAPAGEGRAEP